MSNSSTDFTPAHLPDGPWQVLLQYALALLDDAAKHGGVSDPLWTFGGGTVLMLRHNHRHSKDIDIFVPDPQYLGFFTPHLSDVAEAIVQRSRIFMPPSGNVSRTVA